MPAIPALIGAGASLIGGAISSSAAGSAADKQKATADQALALQKQIYDEQKAQRAPYVAQGATSLAKLGQIAGNAQQQPLPGAFQNPYLPRSGGAGPTQPLGAMGQSPWTQPPPQGAFPPPQGPPPQPPQQGPGGGAGPQMVTIQAPTGETKQVPMATAQQIVQRDPRVKIVGQ